MVWWVKLLITKPEDLSSTPRNHKVERENRFLSPNLHVCAMIHMCPLHHTLDFVKWKLKKLLKQERAKQACEL